MIYGYAIEMYTVDNGDVVVGRYERLFRNYSLAKKFIEDRKAKEVSHYKFESSDYTYYIVPLQRYLQENEKLKIGGDKI